MKLLLTALSDPRLLVGAVGIAMALLYILNFTVHDALRRFIYRHPVPGLFFKLIAVLVTLVLMASDFLAVNNLFVVFNDVTPTEAYIYPMIFAAFLEGFAFLLGLSLSRVVDKTAYQRTDKILNRITLWLNLIFLILSCVLATYLRWNQLTLGMTLEEKAQIFQILSQQDAVQTFLLFSPILTSVLALSLSLFAFPHSSLDQQEKDVEYRRKRYQRFHRRYQDILQQYETQRASLWVDITGLDDVEDIAPEPHSIYLDRCMNRIRRKIVQDVLDNYADMLAEYNLKFEHELFSFISQLSGRTTLPHTISAITVEEILSQYNAHSEEDWDSRERRDAETDRLRRILENTARTAQFRAAAKSKYHRR